MAKRNSQTETTIFDIDLESLLESDFFEVNENNEINNFNGCSEKKKVKTKDDKIPSCTYSKYDRYLCKTDKTQDKKIEESEDATDVKSFFTHFGNDFGKSMEIKKARLGKFTDAIISVYHTKITDMMRQQEKEMNDFKNQSITNFEEYFTKFEDETHKFKQQETKIIKMLEQQIKIMEKFSAIQKEWVGNFRELHKFYVQNFAELINKHRNEALNIKEVIDKDISLLQKKFLEDVKREEMLNMKKYLSDICF